MFPQNDKVSFRHFLMVYKKFNLHMHGYGIKFGAFLLVASLLLPSAVLSSYGQENSIDVVWQMVVIAEDPMCDSYDKTLLEIYSGLTFEYLNLYELSNMPTSTYCLTEKDYQEFESSDAADLLVIVFDEELGYKKMGSNNFDGFYMHTGNDRSQNHVIMICHCSNYENGYERKLTSWILTHELSHFALSLKGYDFAAVERLVHVVDKRYDDCVYLKVGSCENRIHLKPTTITQPHVVFPPLQLAMGDEPVQTLNEEARNSEIVLGFHKEVTRWWLNDLISNDTYLNVTKQVFISPLSLYSGMKLQTGVELPNGVILLDHAKEKPISWNEVSYDKELPAEEKIKDLLSYVPDKTLNSKNDPIPFGDIPSYFKQRAEYWVEEKINDKQFFDSVDRLVRMKIIPVQ